MDKSKPLTRILAKFRSRFQLGVGAWLFLSILTLIVFVLAQSLPLIKTTVWGFWGQERHYLTLILESFKQGQQWMALLSFAISFIIPLLLLALQIYMLIALHKNQAVPGFYRALPCVKYLSPWGMVPVFFLGLLVALYKVADMRSIDLQVGFWAYMVLAILLMAMQGLSAQRLKQMAEEQWGGSSALEESIEAIGLRPESYPGSVSYPRPELKSDLVPAPTKSYLSYLIPVFLVLALALFILANSYPMMEISTLLSTKSYTLLQGVVNLWHAQMPFLAVLIFMVSIFLPLIKIIVLAYLYRPMRQGSLQGPRQVFWYKLLKYSAQWSMLDVIVVLILGVLMNFGFLLSVTPLAGALYYALMVGATVLASACFRINH